MLKIKSFLVDLRIFEKDVPAMERSRTQLIDGVRDGDRDAVRDLEQMVESRRELRQGLELLSEALKNSAATFARFEAKCAKDQLLLAEAKKAGGCTGLQRQGPHPGRAARGLHASGAEA